MKRVNFFVLCLFLLLIPNLAFAMNEVNVYFFYSDDCNICSQEKPYLEALKQIYPNMRIYKYEVSSDANLALMGQAKALYNINETGVPFTIIGDTPYLGFSQGKKSQMQKSVYQFSKNAYENKFGTSVLQIGYRNDLEGEPVEYKENSDYVIEEAGTPTITEDKQTKKPLDSRYRASIILISAGFMLSLVVILLTIFERRHRI